MRSLSLHYTRIAQISCFEFLPSREVCQISNSGQAFHFPELWRSECPSDTSQSEQTAWFLTHTFTLHQYQGARLTNLNCLVHVKFMSLLSYPTTWVYILEGSKVKFFVILTSTVTLPGHTSTLPSLSSSVISGNWHSYSSIVRNYNQIDAEQSRRCWVGSLKCHLSIETWKQAVGCSVGVLTRSRSVYKTVPLMV